MVREKEIVELDIKGDKLPKSKLTQSFRTFANFNINPQFNYK